MSLDTLLEAAKYLENIEQNGDTVRSGSSCSGSLSSSGGDRSPGGYLRLDPNLPISSQFHDYFCNPFLVSQSSALSGARASSSHNNHLNKAANSSASSPGRAVTGRRQSKSVFALSPGSRNISISESSDGGGLSELDSTNGQGTGVIVYSSSSGTVPPPRPSSTTSSTGTNGRSRNSKLDPETSSRHREMHKTLEKNRRAQLRTCFEELRRELPKSDYSYKKSSHINIIHSAIRYIHTLKRSEWEAEQTLKDLLNAKSNKEQKLGRLETELSLSPAMTNGGGVRSKMSLDDFDSNSDDSTCGTNNKKSNNNGNCLTADTAGPGAVSELIGALLKRAESKASGKSHHSQAQLQSQSTTTTADVKPSNDDLYISSPPPSIPLSTSSSHPSHEKHAKATFNNTHYE